VFTPRPHRPPRPRRPTRGAPAPLALAALTLTAALALAACDFAGDGPADPAIPAEHPCPDWALTPQTPGLWTGHLASEAPVPLTLLLPLPPGEAVAVSQGVDQGPTHQGDNRWAWDFAVPVGTPVHAAAPGRVAYVRDDSDEHGADPSFRSAANFILVDHGGGLFTSYVHLDQGSARVGPGDRVLAGEHLADTGLSGQMTGPHLHFHVENVWGQSLPARFLDPARGRCDLLPERGDTVRADHAAAPHLVARRDASPMPAESFAGYGVSALVGLPSRVLDARRTYRLTGAARSGAVEVVVLLVPPGGGQVVNHWRLPVSGGRFEGDVSFALVPPGRYGVGLVAVAFGQPIGIDATVRVTVP